MLATHILKEGPGTPLVFLHGFLGTSWDWEGVCSYLPDCLCIGIDLPGHGKSPFTEEFCGEFPEFGEKIHLVGYSMGGRLAMQVAAQFPERIASLTLCSAHPGLKEEEERKKRVENDRKWAERLLKGSIDEFLREWYDQPIFSGFKPDLSHRRLQQQEGLARALVSYSLGKLPLVEVNGALVLVGERDVKFRGLWEKTEVIAGAGHMVHLENPEGVARMLRR